jgi:Acyl-CoA synthetases (AMP-forming)/AMP-acid ligases II
MIGMQQIAEIANRQPDAIALEMGQSLLTWKEYEKAVRELLPWFSKTMQGRSDSVIIEADASILTFILASIFSSLKVPWVALDPGKPQHVRDAQVQQVEPVLVVRDGQSGDLSISVVSDGTVHVFSEIPKIEDEVSIPDNREFRALGFTSGTTGVPKMVIRTEPSEARRNANFIDMFGFDDTDRFLLCLPLSHASGHGWARTFLAAGGTVVICEAEPSRIAEEILENEITASLLVPPVLEKVLDCIRQEYGKSRVPNHLKFLLTGGRHISPAIFARTLQNFGPVLHSYYGTTETGVNAIASPIDLMIDPRSSGSVMDGSSVVIVDGHGSEIQPGEVGRIVISSYMCAEAYSSGPIPSVIIDNRSYVVTADIGVLAADGSLSVLGRANVNVSPELCGDLIGYEHDLLLLPFVVNTAVAVDVDMNRVDVFLVTDERSGVDEFLLRYLAQKMGQLRCVCLPIDVTIVRELQYSKTGKFDVPKTQSASCSK